jgi:hypothetical protein
MGVAFPNPFNSWQHHFKKVRWPDIELTTNKAVQLIDRPAYFNGKYISTSGQSETGYYAKAPFQ